MNILYTAETEGLAELGTELQELKELSQPDVLLDMVKGWIPDLTSLDRLLPECPSHIHNSRTDGD